MYIFHRTNHNALRYTCVSCISPAPSMPSNLRVDKKDASSGNTIGFLSLSVEVEPGCPKLQPLHGLREICPAAYPPQQALSRQSSPPPSQNRVASAWVALYCDSSSGNVFELSSRYKAHRHMIATASWDYVHPAWTFTMYLEYLAPVGVYYVRRHK